MGAARGASERAHYLLVLGRRTGGAGGVVCRARGGAAAARRCRVAAAGRPDAGRAHAAAQ